MADSISAFEAGRVTHSQSLDVLLRPPYIPRYRDGRRVDVFDRRDDVHGGYMDEIQAFEARGLSSF